ncbi:MAG: AraC family transcriptional regulator [Treponema sp.]|jgi:AraC-like DNA-binding protein|nr:AraC family transcriptional regulator [Treponema sp.]
MDIISHREKKKLEITFPFLCWDSETISFPPHWHDCFEMIFVSKGGMYVSVDDVIYEASAGDLILVNSGAIHGFFDQHSGTVIRGFQFDVTIFDESFINLRDTIFQNPILSKNTIKDAVYERLRLLLCEISDEYRKKAIGYQLAVKSRLYEIMLTILREASGRSAMPPSLKSKRILAFVLKNIDDPDLTLEEAAGALGLSKFYFSHFFKKNTGQSFHSYLNKTRIDFAKRYLIESKMTVTDIVFQSGFNSIQTFNRVFRALTGFSPSEYRRKNRCPPPAGFVDRFIASKNTKKSNY